VSKIIKEAAILTVITLVAGLCLGYVYQITKDPIEVQNEKAKTEAYQAVFEDAEEFLQIIAEENAELQKYLVENDYTQQIINEVMEAKDANGETLGYALTVTDAEGYGGNITFAMGVRLDGTTNGISILSISETAGLGMKADTDDFKNQFKDKKADKFQYTKTGAESDNEIDALSGATITTNAVTNGVNAGLCAVAYCQEGGNQ